jgi:hypothetical protein
MSIVPIPTVKIKHTTDDYAIINESDFDPEVHELYDAPKKEEEPVKQPEVPQAEPPAAPAVTTPAEAPASPAQPWLTGQA